MVSSECGHHQSITVIAFDPFLFRLRLFYLVLFVFKFDAYMSNRHGHETRFVVVYLKRSKPRSPFKLTKYSNYYYLVAGMPLQ